MLLQEVYSDKESLLADIRAKQWQSGYVVTIQRSDLKSCRMTLGCDMSGKHRVRKSKQFVRAHEGKHRPGVSSRLIECPFSIKCIGLRDGTWQATWVFPTHSHDAEVDRKIHPYPRRFSSDTQELLKAMTDASVSAGECLRVIKQNQPDCTATPRDIYNFRAKYRRTDVATQDLRAQFGNQTGEITREEMLRHERRNKRTMAESSHLAESESAGTGLSQSVSDADAFEGVVNTINSRLQVTGLKKRARQMVTIPMQNIIESVVEQNVAGTTEPVKMSAEKMFEQLQELKSSFLISVGAAWEELRSSFLSNVGAIWDKQVMASLQSKQAEEIHKKVAQLTVEKNRLAAQVAESNQEIDTLRHQLALQKQQTQQTLEILADERKRYADPSADQSMQKNPQEQNEKLQIAVESERQRCENAEKLLRNAQIESGQLNTEVKELQKQKAVSDKSSERLSQQLSTLQQRLCDLEREPGRVEVLHNDFNSDDEDGKGSIGNSFAES